ncbi:glycosyltransferase family 4 protein [Methanoculleus sp. YWC-01]|jgi:glycosyltransferase involved in cell wall biosynthesis|uniref:Glycosyltransferase family 4 protein n=2 Tax=Methanoculleus nereidis TaxID=2735141 RepID=A0ABU3Z2D6_9EURY|nr:glycosyltransferase family 4 protein [Methanoculleus sp. YWC-01]
MRICMLTTTHLPHDGRIFEKEAKSLAKEHDVTIIAFSENGSIQEDGGVQIVAVRKPSSNLLHSLTLWRAFRVCLNHKCDVIHCHEPDALLIGVLTKFLKGRRVVYDIHEHWPSEIPFDLGLPNATVLTRILEPLLSWGEVLLARFADAKIAVSESVAERFGRNGTLPVIVSNYSIAGSVPPAPQAGRSRNVIYMAGNMQLFHGIRECIQAMSKVAATFPDVSLTLVGNIREDIGAIAVKTDPRPVITMTGYLPYREMYETLREGSIGLLVFQPDYYNAYIGLPNKLFDYMLCGLPVVASDFPEICKVVSETECGVLVDPTSPDAIAEAIAYLLEHPDEARRMGENGRTAVLERYNWGEMEMRLLEVYRLVEETGRDNRFRGR